MDAMLLERDVWADVKPPDPKVSAMYRKAFEELGQALKEDIDKAMEDERRRIQETAKKAETYMLA